jgi:hypothetical protein
LRGLMLPRMAMPVLNTQSVTDATWAQALQATPLLWYVRRRNLEYRADVAGLGTTASVDDRTQESSLLTRLTDLGLKDRFAALGSTATAAGNAEMVALLSSTKFTADPLLCNAVITDLEQVRPLDRAAVMGVADRYTDPQLGDGLKILEQTNNALTTNSTVLASVSQSGAVPALDQVGRLLPADDLAPFTGQLVQTASSGSPPVVATLINDKLKGLTA